MLRSLWIKIPTLALSVASVVWIDGALGVAVGAGVFLAGTALLLALVMHPNASSWARTIWKAPRRTDAVALTFDDGPDPKGTLAIADVLAEREVPAAFFVVGERVEQHPDILRRLHQDGHLVANHSHSHGQDFHFSFWGRFRREIRACNAAIASVIGREPALFRAPQGIKSPPLGDVLRELDMTAVGWQARGLDSLGRDPQRIAERVLAGARPGGVIMLHDGTGFGGSDDRSATVEALPLIIDGLRARGMRFVRLDELLEVRPYRPVAGRPVEA